MSPNNRSQLSSKRCRNHASPYPLTKSRSLFRYAKIIEENESIQFIDVKSSATSRRSVEWESKYVNMNLVDIRNQRSDDEQNENRDLIAVIAALSEKTLLKNTSIRSTISNRWRQHRFSDTRRQLNRAACFGSFAHADDLYERLRSWTVSPRETK